MAKKPETRKANYVEKAADGKWYVYNKDGQVISDVGYTSRDKANAAKKSMKIESTIDLEADDLDPEIEDAKNNHGQSTEELSEEGMAENLESEVGHPPIQPGYTGPGATSEDNPWKHIKTISKYRDQFIAAHDALISQSLSQKDLHEMGILDTKGFPLFVAAYIGSNRNPEVADKFNMHYERTGRSYKYLIVKK